MVENQLVSVVIPFYDRFDLLEKTMLSIKQQDYTNYEIILIDDCSKTATDITAFRKLFTGHTVIYQRLEENSGPGKARSIGRELASGAFVAYLDSDDLWEPQFLSAAVAKLQSCPEVSMVFTNVLIKNGDKQIRRLDLKEGIYNFFDLIFNKKKYWATGAAVWRSTSSLSKNWKPIRDHEDYVHDILSLQYNPKVFHIPELLCIVNKNQDLGVKRSNNEMLRSLNTLLKSRSLQQQLRMFGLSADFVRFVIFRISKRKYKAKDFTYIFRTYINILRWSDKPIETSTKYLKAVF